MIKRYCIFGHVNRQFILIIRIENMNIIKFNNLDKDVEFDIVKVT